MGLYVNDNHAENNSVILGDRNNQLGTIYCTSEVPNSNAGKWYYPNGDEVAGNDGRFTTEHGGGIFPSYIGLQLTSGFTLMASDQGVYTCIIPDENGIEQSLLVGIYVFGFYGKPVYQCPAIILW